MTNWYVSALASGGGDGSESNPWTLTESFDKVNDETVSPGDNIWVKNDGIYEINGTLAITRGTIYQIIKWEGYGTTIGDGIKATIRRIGGSDEFINIYNQRGYELKNLVIDCNNIGSYGLYMHSRATRCEIKNAPGWGCYRTYCFNCYIHNNGGGAQYSECYGCIVANNSGKGLEYGSAFFSIFKNNGNYNRQVSCYFCVIDQDYGIQILGNDRYCCINCIIVNAIQGLYIEGTGRIPIIRNINFYNCTTKSNVMEIIDTYYELDPQFKDPANFDYTRTGNNLSDKGFSEVGMKSNIDYAIDIGIDQKPIPDYPSEDDVRENISYDYGSKTGNLKLPATTDVRESVGYGSNGTEKVGSLDLPSENDVRLNTKYDNNSKTGKLDLPSTHDVEEGVKYDQNSKVGEFVVPDEGNVKKNVSYGYNNEFTGTLGTTNIELPLNIITELDGEININVEVDK